MSDIRKQIERQLDGFADANHCGAGMIELSDGERKLRCRVLSTDRLACEIESIQVHSPELNVLNAESLDALSVQLSDRISYLEESLTLVEKDAIAIEAQLRSTRPMLAEGAKNYFELIVGRNGVLLQRYQKSVGNQRTTVPAVLSRATVCRLCSDLLDLSHCYV